MRAVSVTDRSSARELLPKGDEQEVLVLRNGRAVALVTPFDDEDAEWYARERDPDFIKSIQRSKRSGGPNAPTLQPGRASMWCCDQHSRRRSF